MELIPLAVGLVAILVGAELFTNGIEWLGRSLGLAQSAIGGVLAAIGTALPETMLPLVAILLVGSDATTMGEEIGVGAILGSPFLIATLAMAGTGVAVWAWRGRRASGTRLSVDSARLAVDIRYFFAAYAAALSVALLPPEWSALRYLGLGVALLIYLAYVRRQVTAEAAEEDEEDLRPLRMRRFDIAHHRRGTGVPRLGMILVQTSAAIVLIVAGAIVFVDAVEGISVGLGVHPALLALIVGPIATELPETANSLIWVRQGKDGLAMGNLTGALVFQASIPTAVGIILAADAWRLTSENGLAFASAVIAFASAALIFTVLGRRGALAARHLLLGGAFYGAYVALVLGVLAGLI